MSGTAWSDSANGSPAGHSSGSSTSTTVATRRTVRTAAYRSSPAPQVTPCYTCRRRRLKCDGARPKCHRCGEESVECLGYKKPLKWVKGVAARGKLMGKNFDEVGSSNEEAGADRDGMRDGKVLARRKGSPGMTVSVEVAGPMHGLVDPVFQDLDSDCRFYISFYEQQFCKILVLHDSPSGNFYRTFIPLAHSSPILLTTIISVGACFYNRAAQLARLSGSNFTDWSTALGSGTEEDTPSFHAYLLHKQRTLSQLSRAVADPERQHDDGLVATILLLIMLDLLESGNGSWRLHLEGAAHLIEHRLSAGLPQPKILPVSESDSVEDANLIPTVNTPIPTTSTLNQIQPSPLLQGMKSFLTGSWMSLYIMGSTFSRVSPISASVTAQYHPYTTLQCFEANSYIGCPAYLLRKTAEITAFRSSTTPTPPASELALQSLEKLLDEVASFDVTTWAINLSTTLHWTTAPHLFHLGSAYKLSVLFYGTQVLRLISPEAYASSPLRPTAEHVDRLIVHLTHLRSSAELIKSAVWPSVIAGAEARTEAQRAYILEYLRYLYEVILSANILGAVKVLRRIWEEGDGLWIGEVEEGRGDWLFV